MLESYDDILTIKELAKALKIGLTQAYILVRSGELKAFKEGRGWRIPKQALIEYVMKHGE